VAQYVPQRGNVLESGVRDDDDVGVRCGLEELEDAVGSRWEEVAQISKPVCALGLVAELSREAGSMMIGDDISIDVEAEAVRSH
jgi:hypothetical protein